MRLRQSRPCRGSTGTPLRDAEPRGGKSCRCSAGSSGVVVGALLRIGNPGAPKSERLGRHAAQPGSGALGFNAGLTAQHRGGISHLPWRCLAPPAALKREDPKFWRPILSPAPLRPKRVIVSETAREGRSSIPGAGRAATLSETRRSSIGPVPSAILDAGRGMPDSQSPACKGAAAARAAQVAHVRILPACRLNDIGGAGSLRHSMSRGVKSRLFAWAGLRHRADRCGFALSRRPDMLGPPD